MTHGLPVMCTRDKRININISTVAELKRLRAEIKRIKYLGSDRCLEHYIAVEYGWSSHRKCSRYAESLDTC